MPVKEIFYSEAYKDDVYEYRHVILPPEQAQLVPRTHLLTETEWRNLGEQIGRAFESHEFRSLLLGLQMSAGWVHFMLHNPGSLISRDGEYVYIRSKANARDSLAVETRVESTIESILGTFRLF